MSPNRSNIEIKRPGLIRCLLILWTGFLLLPSNAVALQIFHDGFSQTATGMFQMGFYQPPPIVPIRDVPGNLRVVENRATYLEVQHDCVTGATGYDYYRSVASGGFTRIGGASCPGGQYNRIKDSNVLPQQDYCYYVVAKNSEYRSDPSPQLCVNTGKIPRVLARSDLDRPVSWSAKAEVSIVTGRLAKQPVSWFWSSGPSDFSGGVFARDHDIAFRARCTIAATEAGQCDTGLVVKFESCDSSGRCDVPTTLYNDDDPAPRAHGDDSGAGSYVDPPRQATGVARYEVHLFSRLRATSHTRLEYSLDQGVTWTAATGTMEVGGLLVDPGPLLSGDWLEAESRNDGIGASDTRMILFESNANRPILSSLDQSIIERDPRIDISSGDYESGRALLLVGKQADSMRPGGGDAEERVETFVDLVHGPHETARSFSRSDCDGPCGAALEAGRYLAWVYAAIDQPVGHLNPADRSTYQVSGDMPIVQRCGSDFGYYDCKECPNDDRDGLGDVTWGRGVTNDWALTLELQKWSCGRGGGACRWLTLASRDIPRALLAADPDGGGYNLLSMEIDSPRAGQYRLVSHDHVSGIRYFEDWLVARNPDASEVKLVSFNSLFGEGDGHNVERSRNAMNLLGTRGRIDPSTGRVEMRKDQAPFQWEADILALQEVTKKADHNEKDLHYSQIMLDELRNMSGQSWRYAVGRGETWTTGYYEGPGMNSTFTNGFLEPRSRPRFGPVTLDSAGCEGLWSDPDYVECHLDESDIGYGDTKNFATPSKARVRRSAPTADRPIAVYNVHLEASSGPGDFLARWGELQDLIETIDAMMALEPSAFNREGVNDPRHYQNRIAIVGDWNVRCHYCGEQYWILRKLREHYGYALDASMAVPDSNGGLSFGMHDQGYPIGVQGAPVVFQHQNHADLYGEPQRWVGWDDAPNHFESSVYPWWASDYRGTTSGPEGVGERLSMVVLVGRGWAYDDPILDYRLMNDRGWTSPMHATPHAVEMWTDGDECGEPGSVPWNETYSYAPNHSLGCDDSIHGGNRPGAAALRTDHKPIGVRLRVWNR